MTTTCTAYGSPLAGSNDAGPLESQQVRRLIKNRPRHGAQPNRRQSSNERRKQMPKHRRRAKPISALLLILCGWGSSSPLQANAHVQPPGASCIPSHQGALALKSPPQLPKIKLNPNSSIQMANPGSKTRQTDQEQSMGPARQVAFETICGGWENSIQRDLRAFWLLDSNRGALVGKFLYDGREKAYEHVEATLTSPVFPSIPLYHSLEDSKYYESCRLSFSTYATIASQIEVLLAPIRTVVAGSSQQDPAAPTDSLKTVVTDWAHSEKNRQTAEKSGESSVWAHHVIVMPKSGPIPQPIPYQIEFSAVPTRVSSAQTPPAPKYLVGVGLSNITLSPQCFKLQVDDQELARSTNLEQKQLQSRSLAQTFADHLYAFVGQHGLILSASVISVLVFSIVYYHLCGLFRRPRSKGSNKRQRVYAANAPDKYRADDELMQKHYLQPISLSLIENVELRDNPNYASLAHEHDGCQPEYDRPDADYIVRYEPDEWEVEMERVVLGSQIGTGAFGMVYLGQLMTEDGPKRCAIKTLPATATLKQRMDFLREASIMKQFNTFHVVKLMGMVSTTNPVYVIMEYMENGDLKSYLRRLRQVHQHQRKSLVDGIYLMAAQIADGMAYLASKRFVHRDLAARNCMVGERGVVKVGDFGLTRDIYDNEYYRRGTHGRLPVRWMAPESLLDNIYTSASDVWSYGIVVWEIVTFSAYPYQGLSNDQVIQRVCAGFSMSRPDHCPDKLYAVMQRCWRREPQERPTFCHLLEELLPETDGHFRANCFYQSALLARVSEGANQEPLLARCEPDNSSRAESYPMISDDRKPLVALYPVVH